MLKKQFPIHKTGWSYKQVKTTYFHFLVIMCSFYHIFKNLKISWVHSIKSKLNFIMIDMLFINEQLQITVNAPGLKAYLGRN